jgi:hypothetical protein
MEPQVKKPVNYDQFLRFIHHYIPTGFKDIDRTDSPVIELEKLTDINNQFFLVYDLIQLKILFTSHRSVEMMGIEPEEINSSVFYKSMHPDDLIWHTLAQTKLFNMGQQLFNETGGHAVISTNFRWKNPMDEYINTAIQCYLVRTDVPYKTVFTLMVFTDISWFKKDTPGYHLYVGNDISWFRYPDEKLLMTGSVFSAV